MRAPPPAVKAYFAKQPPPHRAALLKLRAQILPLVPDASEKLSYGMPAVVHQGRVVVYVAGWRAHCSLFAGYEGTKLARESGLSGFDVNDKGTIRFSPDKPLPARLVKAIVKLRLGEIDTAAAARSKKRAKKRPAPKKAARMK